MARKSYATQTDVIRRPPRPLNEIADEIADDCDLDDLSDGAIAALEGLELLESPDDMHYEQTGTQLIEQFLAETSDGVWHTGNSAKLKNELARRIGRTGYYK